MSRVLMSGSSGAAIYVFSNDHCPPHVHARHRAEGWIARVRFSYLNNAVDLMSIAPLRNTPLRRTISGLLSDVGAGVAACRRGWWMTMRTTCLANQWAIASATGIELVSDSFATASQITVADYDPDEERLTVTFRNGTIVMELGGRDQQ